MEYQPVVFVGMRELMLAFKMLYPEFVKDTRIALRAITNMVAESARQEAALKGFSPPGTSGRGTGLLIGSIRSGLTTYKGYVKDTARNPTDHYLYPARFEYQSHGQRAFLRPAVEKNKDKIYASLALVVQRVSERFGRG